MTINIEQYFMGRDKEFPFLLSLAMQDNANITVHTVNLVLARMMAQGIPLEYNPRTGSLVSSGWRPPAVNEAAGGAVRSKHLTCQAVDLFDPEGEIDDWCYSNQQELETAGLWLEHPSATKGWCHLQTVPPKSKRRVFYP